MCISFIRRHSIIYPRMFLERVQNSTTSGTWRSMSTTKSIKSMTLLTKRGLQLYNS